MVYVIKWLTDFPGESSKGKAEIQSTLIIALTQH